MRPRVLAVLGEPRRAYKRCCIRAGPCARHPRRRRIAACDRASVGKAPIPEELHNPARVSLRWRALPPSPLAATIPPNALRDPDTCRCRSHDCTSSKSYDTHSQAASTHGAPWLDGGRTSACRRMCLWNGATSHAARPAHAPRAIRRITSARGPSPARRSRRGRSAAKSCRRERSARARPRRGARTWCPPRR